MAEAIISSLLSFGLENLKSLLVGAFGNGGSLKMEVEKFESTLTTISAVLQDAEQKQWKSEALKNWLIKLRDVAYDASDVLEDLTTKAHRRRSELQGGLSGRVSHCFSIPNSLQFRFKVIKKLKDVRERLDVIAEERSKFHLTQRVLTGEDEFMETRQTSSLVIESEIFGRGDEKEKLINMLLNDLSDQVDVSICALCGMGGLGKTALAQLVYNDERVIQHFDLRIWVCVSEDFEILRLTRAILESIEGRACNLKELDPLHRSIQEKLSGKRFLLILDDVWNEYPEKWDELKKVLLCGAKGSTIIITTRIEKVALIMATIPIHFIGLLSEEDSYSLFKQRAFGMEDMRASNSTFEVIGKEIVKRCGGVPLAIKALGSLMRLKRSEDEWLSMKQSEILELSNDENGIMSVLRLSYNHLKPYLKRCFAYCSVFPKDHILEKQTLIQHWMGNDFIPLEGQINLYDMGCRIFDELLWRSFFQNVESNNGDTTCRMHDLMHDLAQSVTSGEFFVMEPNNNSTIPNRVRHLYGGFDSLEIILQSKSIHKISSIHTLIQPCSWFTSSLNFIHSSSLNFILSQKYLRVLYLECPYLKSMPNSIGNLIHLKYFRFYSNDVKTLPKSMKNLHKLQTLKLICPELCNLPRGLQQMRELRYFGMDALFRLTCMPPNMGQLSRLQFLGLYIVGKDNRRRISELQHLNLGGTLEIRNLDNVRDAIDARSANLMVKKNIRRLSLCWKWENKRDKTINEEEILDGLQPHPNLEELCISGYEGSKFPNWMMNLHLQNLKRLSLGDCTNCECLPPLGKLRFLQFLHLYGMHAIKCFDSDCNGDGLSSFSALMGLYISRMPNLEEWLTLDGIEVFPKLNELRILKCPKLGQLPLLPTLKDLSLDECCGSLLWSVASFSLTSLSIFGISELTTLPHGLLQNLMALESLNLGNLNNLKSIELGNVSTLKRLDLSYCSELELQSEELLNLVSLETLLIRECHSLVWLPASGMQSLYFLSVADCKALESLGKEGQHLTSLRQLHIRGCPALKSLSATMRHLNSLQILYCKGLISLPDWIGSLTSLSLLEIRFCPNLMSLPEGLQNIGSLNRLIIKGCPLLERRCKRETGEDWHKIAHIPKVFIIPTNTSTSTLCSSNLTEKIKSVMNCGIFPRAS